MIQTGTLPNFKRYDDNVPFGPPYFTVSHPAHWVPVVEKASPLDPRAQLGWLDSHIDQVKGVLKTLEAWRRQVIEVEPQSPKPEPEYEVIYRDDLLACRLCGAVVARLFSAKHSCFCHRS